MADSACTSLLEEVPLAKCGSLLKNSKLCPTRGLLPVGGSIHYQRGKTSHYLAFKPSCCEALLL